MQNRATTTLLVFASLALAVPLAGSQELNVRVTPVMAREPAALRIQAVIEADDRNRSLEITARSIDYVRSSQIQLDGRDAQRVWDVEFRDVPHGNYEVTATLMGSEGKRAAVTKVVMVLSQHPQ